MTDEMTALVAGEVNKSREELLEIIAGLRLLLRGQEGYRINNSAALEAMSVEFNRLKLKLAETLAENGKLKAQLAVLTEQNCLKTMDAFGRATEKTEEIINDLPVEVMEDEAAIEAGEPRKCSGSHARSDCRPETGKSVKHGKRSPGKKAADLSGLPSESLFMLDVDALNTEHGQGNWRIAFWRCHTTLEKVPAAYYARHVYTPVISVGLEHSLMALPQNIWYEHSFASPSVVAGVIYDTYRMYVPLYRQEAAFMEFGLNISRQTMSNWIKYAAGAFFRPVYDRLREIMMSYRYHQCDETFFEVIADGRSAGSKSYMWVHITSELLDDKPTIVLYCYEPTRGTDHLRTFYKDFEGYITCDAYCAYQILGRERNGNIIICGCMMHLRRRFAQALALIDTSSMTRDAIEELPEVKALSMIGRIYKTDEALKKLSADERTKRRQEEVRPLVDEFYEFIEGFDLDNPLLGNKLKDAISYSINQKEYICRFIGNGNVPIDDGATERHIRPFTIYRNNSLFCYSTCGAETAAIMFSVIETARACGANVYRYIEYVLTKMPDCLNRTDRSAIDRMLPWSEEYKEFEKKHDFNPANSHPANCYSGKPGTPRKKNNYQITATPA